MSSINDSSIFALHGAAVEYNCKAYIFLASTTSGKTTLASYLVSNSFGYITDDCILLDKNNFTIHPVKAPIQLRTGGLKVLKDYKAEPQNIEVIENEKDLRYVYMPDNYINNPLPIEKIFFIRRTANINSLIPMNTTTRITELMKSPIREYPVTSEYIRFISQLTKYECQYLLYHDMNYVIEVIKNE